MFLNGWKEIAAHVGRGVRTVQRWESIGLPVHRPHGKVRSAVVADSDELDQWVRATSIRTTDLEQLRQENIALRDDCERLRNECNTNRRELDRLREENKSLRRQFGQIGLAVQRKQSAPADEKRSA